jgi:hypothetical protein
MGVVGAALRGFGKALSKKSGTITRVPIAKRLTQRRKDTEALFKTRQDAGAKPIKGMAAAVKSTSAANTKYDKAVKATKDYNKNLKRKVIGGAGAAGAVVMGAHGAAKKKFPKYKKVMESDVVIKDGKLGLRPKKKK